MTFRAGDLVKLKENYRKNRFGGHAHVDCEAGLILEVSPATRYMEETVLVSWGNECSEVEFPHWLEVINADR